MAKKKKAKTKKNGEPTRREKDKRNLEKVRFFTKTKNISQFVKKTDIEEIDRRKSRTIINELLIPFALITSRIEADGTPVGRTVDIRRSRVYEIVAEDIRSLIDANVSMFDPQSGRDVSLRFLLNDLIQSGATERVETEQAVKEEEKKQKEAEKEERKKVRTEERAKRKTKAEESQKEKLSVAKNVELVQQERNQELRQEVKQAEEDLQRRQQNIMIENQFSIVSGTESESSSSSSSSLVSGDFFISMAEPRITDPPRETEEETRARLNREFKERASGRFAPDVQPYTEEEAEERIKELKRDVFDFNFLNLKLYNPV